MPPIDPNSSEEEILLAFSVEPKHDRSTLERYIARYPDHVGALVDCAVELLTLPAAISPVWVAESAVEASWQKFQSFLTAGAGSAVASPFAKLSPSAFKQLAVRLNINNLLLLRIRDRGIRAASIPGALVRRLADELGASAQSVAAYLQGPPEVAAASAFRSAGKPAATTQVEFQDAVKTSQLTAEQQGILLALED